jgi:hypothetical protein
LLLSACLRTVAHAAVPAPLLSCWHGAAGSGVPPPAAVFGVTRCAKPDHAGVKGELTHYCARCSALVCLHCGHDEHLSLGHTIEPLPKAAATAATALTRALGELRGGCAHQRSVRATGMSDMATVRDSFELCREELERRRAARHAQVDVETDALQVGPRCCCQWLRVLRATA